MITTIIFAVVALIIGGFGGYAAGKETGYNEGWNSAKGLNQPVVAAATTPAPKKVVVKQVRPARVAPKGAAKKARRANKR